MEDWSFEISQANRPKRQKKAAKPEPPAKRHRLPKPKKHHISADIGPGLVYQDVHTSINKEVV